MASAENAGNFRPELARSVLAAVLKSKAFSSSPNLAQLLGICAEESLAGRKLTQDEIARAMRYRHFSAAEDSRVRREVGRLRQKLRDYYADEGAHDPLVISIPKALKRDGYSAEFSRPPDALDEESESSGYLLLLAEARRALSRRSPDGVAKAISLYRQAIDEDPGHSVSAHTSLAECHFFMAIWGLPPRDMMPKVRAFAEGAVALQAENAVAHALLGMVASVYDWEWARGEALLRRAQRLAPQSINVSCWHSDYRVCVGDFRQAVALARRGQALEDSPSSLVLSHVGKILYVAGENDEAYRLLNLSLEIDPSFYFAHWLLGLVQVARGEPALALGHLREASALVPESASVVAALGYAEAVSGDRAAAAERLRTLRQMQGSRYVPATEFAMVHVGMGEPDAAFDALGRAFEEKCLYLSWLHAWPPYRDLQDDARFGQMLSRLGLTEALWSRAKER